MMYALHFAQAWGPLPPVEAFRFVTFGCGHTFGCWVDPDDGKPVPGLIASFIALGETAIGKCHACLGDHFQEDGLPQAMVSRHRDGSWWFLLLPAEPIA